MTPQPPMPPFPWRILTLLAVALIAGMLFSRCVLAGTATLNWNAVTLNTNGTPIVGPVTYRVFKGLKGYTKTRIATVSATKYVVYSLPKGTWCFQVRTAAEGTVSKLSNNGCKVIS